MIKQYKYPQNSSKCQPENCCNIGIIDIHSTHIHDRWFSEMVYTWMINDLWLGNCYGISVWQMTWMCSVCDNHNLSFHHSWLITEFVTIVTRQVPLVEHAHCFNYGARVIKSFLGYVVHYRSSFALFSLGHCIVCPSIHGFWFTLQSSLTVCWCICLVNTTIKSKGMLMYLFSKHYNQV
jgi:hypothetical protein